MTLPSSESAPTHKCEACGRPADCIGNGGTPDSITEGPACAGCCGYHKHGLCKPLGESAPSQVKPSETGATAEATALVLELLNGPRESLTLAQAIRLVDARLAAAKREGAIEALENMLALEYGGYVGAGQIRDALSALREPGGGR